MLVKKSIKKRQGKCTARSGVVARRRADDTESPAVEKRLGFLFVQSQATLEKNERWREWLRPAWQAVLIDHRLVMALPEKDLLFREQAAELVLFHRGTEESRRLVAGIV